MATLFLASVLAVIFLFGGVAESQLYENDRCFILGSEMQGVCKYSRDCPWATRQFRLTGVRPTNCGFDGDSVIVCCVENNSNTNNNKNQGSNNNQNNNGNGNTRNPGNQFGNNINFGGRPSTVNNNPINFNANRGTSSNNNNNGNSGNTGSSPSSGNILSSADISNRRGGRKTISERKCEIYSSSVTRVIEGLLLLPEPETLTIKVPKCDYSSTPLIVGGSETEVGEFLTCPEPTAVRLGEHSISKSDEGAQPQDIGIASVIVHPSYEPPSKYHDIALIRLSSPARFGNYVRPACISQSISPDQQPSVATGWGKIAYAKEPSDVLLKVSIKVISTNRCAPIYEGLSRNSLARGLIEQQICAGELGKDTCQGDSGGPLQVSDNTNRCIFHVIGVTSFGSGCGGPNSPGVYTSVAHYRGWIESVVWPSG